MLHELQQLNQMDYGKIEFDTRSQKYKILNHKKKVIYDSSRRTNWSPEDYVAYENYFFRGEEYNKMKLFLEEMSDQTIEITQYKIAYYYV